MFNRSNISGPNRKNSDFSNHCVSIWILKDDSMISLSIINIIFFLHVFETEMSFSDWLVH